MSSEELDATLAELHVTDATGRVVVEIALLATLYLRGSHDAACRQRVAEVFDRYVGRVDGALRWIHGGRGLVAFGGAAAAAVRGELTAAEGNSTPSWEVLAHGGERKEDASGFRFAAFGPPAPEPGLRGMLGFVSFAFPLTFFAGAAAGRGFPSFVLEACKDLRPVHGYGGIGIVESPNRSIRQIHEAEVASLALRHPGLEVDYPLVHCWALRDDIKGTNWLTALGEDQLGKLSRGIGADSREGLEEALGPHAMLNAYDGGVLIVAGDHPQIGDTNANLQPEHYGAVARLLRPLRVSDHPGVHVMPTFGPGGFSAWLSRFDMPP